MHSLAASSGMVASSGFSRMHSFSTFTARADLAKESNFCETQNVRQNQTLTAPPGGLVSCPLNAVFQREPNPGRAWVSNNQNVGLLSDGGVNWGETRGKASLESPSFSSFLELL